MFKETLPQEYSHEGTAPQGLGFTLKVGGTL